ncbi:MAG: YbhB/YbcL family Raf kinase inhibitor-like protein [Rhabdochlamydiaceae bacterium]|nr:YbhB/YbcL family Raf kinase inhibitor-like protein [Rhabdochlamydiaceae bacterium]
MHITSPAFEPNGKIPSEYTCDGKNINPQLIFTDIPKNAEVLVLIMDDPDVPEFVRKDRMWVHWVVYNIPATHVNIEKDTQPPGIPGMNTGGALNYQGPCPPDREHRYFFKLYALKSPLDLPRGSTKAEVERAMQPYILAETQLMGRYERKSQ